MRPRLAQVREDAAQHDVDDALLGGRELAALDLPADAGTAGYVLTSGGGASPLWLGRKFLQRRAEPASQLLEHVSRDFECWTITVSYGGAGATTLAANGLLIGNGTSPVNALAPQNSSVLLTNGSGVPGWATASNDNFAQYALLAGRAGGQALDGGTAAGDSLTLNSTSHAGPTGYVLLQTGGGSVGIGTTTPVSSLDLSQKKDAITLPSGNGTTDRPGSPVAGMLRYNTGGTLEFYNGASWQTLGVSGAGISSLTAGTGLTGGTITTSGTIALATPTTSTIGGVEAINSVSHEWISAIDTSGVPQLLQPSVSDLTNGTLGTNTSTTGQLGLANGNASGATVTVQNNSATAAYNFNLPAAAGASGSVLTSGGGVAAPMTWTTLTGEATTNLSSGQIWIGNAGNVSTAVTPAGDATISNTGATTVAKVNGVAYSSVLQPTRFLSSQVPTPLLTKRCLLVRWPTSQMEHCSLIPLAHLRLLLPTRSLRFLITTLETHKVTFFIATRTRMDGKCSPPERLVKCFKLAVRTPILLGRPPVEAEPSQVSVYLTAARRRFTRSPIRP